MKEWISEWSSQLYAQHKQLRKKAWNKKSALKGIQTHYLCDPGVVLYQLNYRASW